MAIATALARRFDLTAPIVLAPMAGVSGGALAAAVSHAGGLGMIGVGYEDRAWLSRELDAAGVAPIGVGFITWKLAKDPDLLAIALERHPRAVFLSFGDISGFVDPIKRSGVTLITQVQTVADAQAAAECGADFLVAQGAEAGGHGGSRGTLALVPAIVDAVGDVPVLAAGGIADGRGLAAALMLGAAGVVCGTAFFACAESLAHPNAKSAAVVARGDQTSRNSVFDMARGLDWPRPWTLRALNNAFSRRWCNDLPGLAREITAQRATYAAAVRQGDTSIAAVIVGEAVDLVRSMEPADRVVAQMLADCEARLLSAGAIIDARALSSISTALATT